LLLFLLYACVFWRGEAGHLATRHQPQFLKSHRQIELAGGFFFFRDDAKADPSRRGKRGFGMTSLWRLQRLIGRIGKRFGNEEEIEND